MNIGCDMRNTRRQTGPTPGASRDASEGRARADLYTAEIAIRNLDRFRGRFPSFVPIPVRFVS